MRKWLIASVLVLLCVFAGVVYWRWWVAEVQEVPFSVEVVSGKVVGFNAGVDQLYFGKVPPEAFAERRITLTTSEHRLAVIKVEGAQASWIQVSENDLVLQPGVGKEVIFRCSVPTGTPAGNYTGKVRVEFRRIATFK